MSPVTHTLKRWTRNVIGNIPITMLSNSFLINHLFLNLIIRLTIKKLDIEYTKARSEYEGYKISFNPKSLSLNPKGWNNRKMAKTSAAEKKPFFQDWFGVWYFVYSLFRKLINLLSEGLRQFTIKFLFNLSCWFREAVSYWPLNPSMLHPEKLHLYLITKLMSNAMLYIGICNSYKNSDLKIKM